MSKDHLQVGWLSPSVRAGPVRQQWRANTNSGSLNTDKLESAHGSGWGMNKQR